MDPDDGTVFRNLSLHDDILVGRRVYAASIRDSWNNTMTYGWTWRATFFKDQNMARRRTG